MPRPRRTGLHAGRLARDLRNVLVVDAVDAERAFLHHAFDFRILARTVGAGPAAELAADALVLVHEHDAVFGALVAGAGRADGHAGRCLAMQAGAREMQGHRRLVVQRIERVAVHAIEPDAHRLGAVGVLVGQRSGDAAGIPFLAGHRAGMAADADIEIDDETEFLRRRRRQHRHAFGLRRWIASGRLSMRRISWSSNATGSSR